ncbi:MAG: response regulator transcription factor [Chitinophagaceae bacterium]
MQNKIRVIISDDQDISRHGLLHIIQSHPEFVVVGSISKSENVLEIMDRNHPDIFITSIEEDALTEFEITQSVAERFPQIGILVISMFQQTCNIIRMLQAGVKGCLLKNARTEEVTTAIRAIHNLEQYYSLEIRGKLNKIIANGDFQSYLNQNIRNLTDHDKLFLRLLCQEFTIKQISVRMSVTIRSIENKKQKLYHLLNKTNIAGLIIYAITHGIYNPYND